MIRELYQRPSSMEPLMPSDRSGELQRLAGELWRRSAQLGSILHPGTRSAVVEMLRAMNSYYSNLIEGHHTTPLEIEGALRNEYSQDPAKRALQQESRAHVEVQKLVEARLANDPGVVVSSAKFLQWMHREFYSRLPEEFRTVKTRSGGSDEVVPGAFRACEVEVGRHVPPASQALPDFLDRFEKAYRGPSFNPLERIVAVAASHHRLTWIHPFLDGNGRVTRLYSHAAFTQAGAEGHGLWAISRGLGRSRDRYLSALAGADLPRQGDLDGRGNLSDRALEGFCEFFLKTAIDQVDFMSGLLELDGFQDRVVRATQRWIERAHRSAKLGSRLGAVVPELLRQVLLRGLLTRGEAATVLQMPERSARRMVTDLLEAGLLETEGRGGVLRLGLPMDRVGYYFPKLFPEGVEFVSNQDAGF